MEASNTGTGSTSVFDITNLMLRLVLSKDGVVLRRLLMTADGASLVRAVVSKEASCYRQQLCRIASDILYQSFCEAFGRGFRTTPHGFRVRLASGADKTELGSSSGLSTPVCDYQALLKDRRLKVISLKVLDSARKDPILMLRLCWASIIILVRASALACHRLLVSLSEAYLGPLSLAPKQFVTSA